jgi:dienelactone hydrolase
MAREAYPTAHDRPLDATEAVRDEADDYARYRVEFNGIRGGRVPAYLYVPKDSRGKHPGVLLQYGSGGNKNTNYIVLIARRFVKKGFVVLTIDVPGRGERRAEKRGMMDGKVIETLGDYSRAVDYLVSRKDVDAERVAYCGISWGAITGLTFAAHDERIKVVVSLVGGGGFLGLVPGEINEETRKSVQAWDPVFHVGKIAPRPLLLLNVTKDQLVPRVLADALHKAAPEYAKRVWLETDHFFNGLNREDVADEVGEFIEENLSKSVERNVRRSTSNLQRPTGKTDMTQQ